MTEYQADLASPVDLHDTKRAFVDPRDAGDGGPRFGRPGGVLPRVFDA